MSDNDRDTSPGDASARLVPTRVRENRLRLFLLAVYNYLVSGLALTALVTYITHDSGLDRALADGFLFWPVVLLPLALAILVDAGLDLLGDKTAEALFFAYAIAIGLSLGCLFPALFGFSVAPAFFTLALSFGALSLYAHLAEADPAAPPALMIMVRTGIVAAALVAWFSNAGALLFLVSAAGVFLLLVVTALRMRRIKDMHQHHVCCRSPGQGAVQAALSLYVDVGLRILRLRQSE